MLFLQVTPHYLPEDNPPPDEIYVWVEEKQIYCSGRVETRTGWETERHILITPRMLKRSSSCSVQGASLLQEKICYFLYPESSCTSSNVKPINL